MINCRIISLLPYTAIRHVLLGFLLLKLTGCTTINTSEQPSIIENPFIQNHHLKNWQLQGKIGIRTADNAVSAYINWQQCGNNYDIRLNGPLGIGSTRLYGNMQRAFLDQGKGPIAAANPQQLLEKQLGWAFPIEDLLFWVRGLAVPTKTANKTNELNQFQQNGWLINYGKPIKVSTYWLPSKTIAKHVQTDDRRIKVTLISRKWHLSPNCEAR